MVEGFRSFDWDFVGGFARDLFISEMPGRGGSGETDTTSSGVGGSFSGSRVASVVLDVSGLRPLNPKGEAHSLSQRWKRWKQAFNLYVTGKSVSNDAQKRVLLACCWYERSIT